MKINSKYKYLSEYLSADNNPEEGNISPQKEYNRQSAEIWKHLVRMREHIQESSKTLESQIGIGTE